MTVPYGVPFIDSAFALEAWVTALTGKNQLTTLFPLQSEKNARQA
jgi:hypothetical protein